MCSVFRRVVLWLLVCALPLQALAATSKLQCVASHQRMQQAAQAQRAAPCHETEVLAFVVQKAGADDAVGLPHIESGADVAGQGDTPTTDAAAVQKVSCSNCAQCCHALALPMSLPLLADLSTERETCAPVPVPALAYQTGGQDRPPRASHA